MPDREKIIYDIERCTCHVPDACRDCSHYTGTVGYECMEGLMRDALDLLKDQEDLGTELMNAVELIHKKNERIEKLLKEQEPVAPVLEQDSMVCGNCGHEVIWQKWLNGDVWLDEQLDYCPHCGKAVKWE